MPALTNVWARNLTGGALAVVFINAGASSAAVSCDKVCFGVICAPFYQQRSIYQDRLGTNIGKAEKRVVFLQACFGAMGLPPTVTHLAARDLWTHTANGTVAVGPSAEGLTVTLAPSAVAMFKMTPSNEYSS
eukprot:COSAG06_NODE_1853_length_8212_cov_2.785529_7_plen_132_part_00